MITKALKENKEVMIMMDTNIDTSTNRIKNIHTPSRMKKRSGEQYKLDDLAGNPDGKKFNIGNGSLQTAHNPTKDKKEDNRQEREPGLQIQLNPRDDNEGTERK